MKITLPVDLFPSDLPWGALLELKQPQVLSPYKVRPQQLLGELPSFSAVPAGMNTVAWLKKQGPSPGRL